MKIRSYSELAEMKSFEDRFNYLKLDGEVGKSTFGYERFLNQVFYKSKEWKRIRDQVILRDNGCDLGCEERPVHRRIIIHHMNPIDSNDIERASEYLLNPEYLISVSHETHNAIHYGDVTKIKKDIVERKPNDTCPWKK